MSNKILAIDYGTKKIGLAISDENAEYVSSLPVLHYKQLIFALEKLVEIVKKEKISKIVLGLPLDINLQPTVVSKKVLEFKNELSKLLPEIEFDEWNETLTTKLAKSNAIVAKYKRSRIDSEAARIMLQEYIDFKINQI